MKKNIVYSRCICLFLAMLERATNWGYCLILYWRMMERCGKLYLYTEPSDFIIWWQWGLYSYFTGWNTCYTGELTTYLDHHVSVLAHEPDQFIHLTLQTGAVYVHLNSQKHGRFNIRLNSLNIYITNVLVGPISLVCWFFVLNQTRNKWIFLITLLWYLV